MNAPKNGAPFPGKLPSPSEPSGIHGYWLIRVRAAIGTGRCLGPTMARAQIRYPIPYRSHLFEQLAPFLSRTNS